jgi:AAA family ATP:ADP antiporter
MATKAEKSGLEKLLGVFTDVESGEGGTALLLTFNIFLLLTAYYVIKPVRAGLILTMESGAEYKSYMGGVIAIALLGAVPLYTSFAKKLPRNTLVVGVTLFFVSHLGIFYVLSSVASVKPYLGLIFFLWVGIFNMMVIAQFWAFANDIYTQEQGKRLFALIGIGASSGAALGSAIAKFIIPVIGLFQMLLVAGALLSVCAFITQVVHKRELNAARAAQKDVKSQLKVTVAGSSSDLKEQVLKAKKATEEAKKQGAFGMVFKYRYLLLMAAFSLLFTFINTNGEYILDTIVSDAAKAKVASGEISKADMGNWIGAWFGDFFLYVNILGVALQSFVVSRLVKFGGVKWALLFFPVIALFDAVALAAVPILLTVRIGKTVENASDYSVNNTARNMLWLPTTKAMKYQAKQAVDTFFVRMGDVASALLVALFSLLSLTGARPFAITNIVLVAVLLYVCRLILKEEKVLKKMREDGDLIDTDDL